MYFLKTIAILFTLICSISNGIVARGHIARPDSLFFSKSVKKISGEIQLNNGNKTYPVSYGFNLKLGSKSNWLQCDLVNTDTLEIDAIIELSNPFLKQVKFYTLDSLGIKDSLICGAEYIFNYRPNNHPNFQYPIKLSAGAKVSCLIEIEVGNVSGDFKLLIWNTASRNEFQLLETKYLSYFFIINVSFLVLIAIAIINTKQRFHWYYFIYALFGFFYIYTEVGLGFKNFWPDSPNIQNHSILLIANIYQIFGLLFVSRYFNTKVRNPILNKALDILILTGILFELTIIGYTIFNETMTVLFSKINTVIFIISGIVAFLAAIFSLRFKNLKSDAIWFMIGFAPHAISILQLCLRPFGLYNTTDEYWFRNFSPIYLDTIHPPNFLLWSVIWEVIIVFWLIIKRLRKLFEENTNMMQQLAFQREKNMQTLLTGVEKERQRIAQELHDGSGVALSALKMKLNLLKDTNKENEKVNSLMKDVDRIYEEIRNISHNLMPKTLSKLGLYPAIDELINQFRLAAPQIKFNYYKKTDISIINETARINIFRVVQELLTNIVKHSEAKEVSLQLIKHNDALMISVEDDGIGFDTRETSNGIGLTSIESRVQMLDGTFSIDAAPQNGTFISIFLPIKKLK